MIRRKYTDARRRRQGFGVLGVILAFFCIGSAATSTAQTGTGGTPLTISIDPSTAKYSVSAAGMALPVFRSGVAVRVDGRWVHCSDYPHHDVVQSSSVSDLGPAHRWRVACSGLKAAPDLLYQIDALSDSPFAEFVEEVHNSTAREVHVDTVRSVEVSGPPAITLGGSDGDDRVLSDSFSEDHPQLAIRDLADAEAGVHRAVGSQLIYNRKTHQSLLLGALTSDRFLSFLSLRTTGAGALVRTASLEVDATGITKFQKGYSLRNASAEDQVEATIPLAAGGTFTSEKLLIGVGSDYHQQLEQYGGWIRTLHHARVTSPSSMGWWSWTAYYFGLTEGTAWANAEWLAEHLKSFGYNFFHIDEGYQFARGEYTTADAAMFPHGVEALEDKVRAEGLVPGVWTAPFQVSERSWVYQQHPEWLVANAAGKPIQLGFITDKNDRLYVLDVTHPGAQEYLRTTYHTLVRDWGIRYIKLDFMDDAAIEGYYYRAHTTAMEAQTIGLHVIREAVGEDVLLDKDGSAMLNPVGIVDTGRISQDTGHTFGATRDAATGVAARYYMNRNFFVSDPDAFSVSTQVLKDQVWHGGETPVTLDEAKTSIVLSAVAGGMYEIGDDLPRLSAEPERLALIENRDLINMALLGRASLPVDLMDYRSADEQPSIFFLRETPHQSILTVFDWTDGPRSHTISLASLGLAASSYAISDVLDGSPLRTEQHGTLQIDLPAHSVRVLKIVAAGPAVAPRVQAQRVVSATTGAEVSFTAAAAGPEDAITDYLWDFGDGVTTRGAKVIHAYTHEGGFLVTVRAAGVEGLSGEDSFSVEVSGQIPTTFVPGRNRRQHVQD